MAGNTLTFSSTDPSALEAVVRHHYPDPVDQGLLVLAFQEARRLSSDPKRSAKDIFDGIVKFEAGWKKAAHEGRGPWDTRDFLGDVLTAGSALVSAIPSGSRSAGALSAGQSLLELSFVKDELALERDKYSRQSQHKLVRISEALSLEIEAWAERCLSNSACAEASAFAWPKLAAGNKTIPVAPAEVVFEHGEVFTAPMRKGARPDGSVVVKIGELKTALQAEFEALVGEVRSSNAPILRELAIMKKDQETVLEWVNAQKAAEQQRKAAEEAAARRTEIVRTAEPILAGAEAGLGVLTALTRKVDPKFAEDLARVGSAAIKVARAGVALVQAGANLVMAGITAVAVAGAMAATGNFIGAAISLIGAFLGGGKDVNQQILEEIGKLREEMRTIRAEMHDRFNRIDKALEQIYTDVMTQLDKILIEQRKLNGKADQIIDVLARHSETLNRIERNLSDYFQAGQRAELKTDMNNALLRPSRSESPKMTPTEYKKFEAAFYTWAVETCRGPIESPVNRPTDNAALDTQLTQPESESADNLAFVARIARKRGWPDFGRTSDGDEVPNPKTWSLAADAFSQLEGEWPHRAAKANSANLNGRRKDIRRTGRIVQEALRAIVEQVDEDGRNVLEHACDNVADAAASLGRALGKRAEAWESDRKAAAAAAQRPWIPAWTPRVPPTDFYAPDIPVHAVYGHTTGVKPEQLFIPKEVGLHLPPEVRAVAVLYSHGNPLMAYVRAQFIKPFMSGKLRFGYAHVTVEVNSWAGRHPDLFEPVATIELSTDVPEPDIAPILLPSRWQSEWAPKLKSAWHQTNGDYVNWCRGSLRQWQLEECRKNLLPTLAQSIRADDFPALADSAAAYRGAIALLDTLLTLGMPLERQDNDLVRAVLDGLSFIDGGTGLPDVASLALLVERGGIEENDWGLHLPEANSQPTVEFANRVTGSPLDALGTYLRRLREAHSLSKARPRQPILEHSMRRLDISAAVVRAGVVAAKAPAPSPPAIG